MSVNTLEQSTTLETNIKLEYIIIYNNISDTQIKQI